MRALTRLIATGQEIDEPFADVLQLLSPLDRPRNPSLLMTPPNMLSSEEESDGASIGIIAGSNGLIGSASISSGIGGMLDFFNAEPNTFLSAFTGISFYLGLAASVP